MKPGRELDMLIAEKMMGRKTKSEPGGYWGDLIFETTKHPFIPKERVPNYSTDIAAAWEVVEKLEKWKFTLTWEWSFGGGSEKPKCFATAIFDPVLKERRPQLLAVADTAPHAICLAALKAVGYNETNP